LYAIFLNSKSAQIFQLCGDLSRALQIPTARIVVEFIRRDYAPISSVRLLLSATGADGTALPRHGGRIRHTDAAADASARHLFLASGSTRAGHSSLSGTGSFGTVVCVRLLPDADDVRRYARAVAKRGDAALADRMNAELMAHEALYNERLQRAIRGESLERRFDAHAASVRHCMRVEQAEFERLGHAAKNGLGTTKFTDICSLVFAVSRHSTMLLLLFEILYPIYARSSYFRV
jgi:hypothetical protein